MNPSLRKKGEIKFTFFKGQEEFRSTAKKISEYPNLPDILEQFSLGDFTPANYRIQVSLFVNGKEVLSESEYFDVTYAEAIKAIYAFDKAISRYGLNINLLNSIGECYFQVGNIEEALAAWQKSLEINTDQPEIQKSVKVLKEKK